MTLISKRQEMNIIRKSMEFKNIFLDTNILVDIVANRLHFAQNAIAIFNYCKSNEINMFATSHSIATMHYITKKVVEEVELRSIIDDLLNVISIIPVTEPILRKSLKSNHKDFEDAIQIYSAQSLKQMDCIITRDLKDYKNSEIQVYTPDQFLNQL
jgi:predicted nucleic acid-binding protein